MRPVEIRALLDAIQATGFGRAMEAFAALADGLDETEAQYAEARERTRAAIEDAATHERERDETRAGRDADEAHRAAVRVSYAREAAEHNARLPELNKVRRALELPDLAPVPPTLDGAAR